MRIAHNKQKITQKQSKQIRKMFCQKKEMKEIEQQTQLTERVIRRIILEKNWSKLRERYYRILCHISLSKAIPLNLISERTGVNYYGLCRIRKKYQISKAKRKSWNDRRTEGLEQKVIALYNSGQTGKQIIEKFEYKRRETVYQILEKHKVERREAKIQTYYDEAFFEKINTHEKAYVLGLIMTDGNIIKNYNGFEIQLTEEDGYILEKISDLIGASKTHPVQKISCNAKRRQKGFENTKDMIRLTVHSRKIAEDLKRLGVVKNKTKILRYNDCVPDKFLSSFFRGLIDGDGTVGIRKDGKTIWWSLASASKEFIDDLCGVDDCFYRYGSKDGKMHYLMVRGGRIKLFKILQWMYNNKDDFYLRRKYAKVQDKIG